MRISIAKSAVSRCRAKAKERSAPASNAMQSTAPVLYLSATPAHSASTAARAGRQFGLFWKRRKTLAPSISLIKAPP